MTAARLRAIVARARALDAEVEASLARIRALGRELEAQLVEALADEDLEEDGDETCPQCGGRDLVEADDDVKVCAGCNANIREGKVVNG
jgi:hypothetical protein